MKTVNLDGIIYREVMAEDNLETITILLNQSYKRLYDMGLHYVAANQDLHTTRKRIEDAHTCFVGILEGHIIATLALYEPKPSSKSCAWYNQGHVAKIGQFAVREDLQGYGIGSHMMTLAENQARKIKNVKSLALDTAETAHHLVDFYKKRGYEYIEKVSWKSTNYESLILSKSLR
jgi:GNAT superfamily N-acetyltransferase